MPTNKFSLVTSDQRNELEILREQAGYGHSKSSSMVQPVPEDFESEPPIEKGSIDDVPSENAFDERQLGSWDLVDVAYLEQGTAVARAVCKLHAQDNSGYYTGTAFLVAERLLVTNHHNLPTKAIAKSAFVEFEHERGQNGLPRNSERFILKPEDAYWADEQLDVCIVAVASHSQGDMPLNRYNPLRLDPAIGKIKKGQFITIIHHPDGDWKQVALRENRLIKKDGTVLWYSSDTSPGSSGAPCFSDQWQVVAIHRKGVPQTKADNNNLIALRNGQFMSREQINDLRISDRDILWIANEGTRVSVFINAIRQDPIAKNNDIISAWISELGPQRFNTLPVNMNTAIISEPDLFDENRRPKNDYEKRNGYQPDFLGIDIPPPSLDEAVKRWGHTSYNSDTGESEFTYYNFSVWMSRERRMAFVSAVNIDGANHKQRNRNEFGGDKWEYDDRLSERLQIGNWFYGNEPARYHKNYFDRGHIVRRTEPSWGSDDSARLANDDTYHWTNCAPQYKDFNQRSGHWQGLEKYLLEKGAIQHNKRLTLYSGPIFSDDDTEHRSVLVPKRFFKVAIFIDNDGNLKSAAFVLDQSQWVDVIDFEKAPTLNVHAARHSIRWLEEQTGLDFGDLVRNADAAQKIGDDLEAIGQLDDIFA